MKKRILLLLLVIPALIKAQDVMTETRQELTSPDGAYRFTFYQRAVAVSYTHLDVYKRQYQHCDDYNIICRFFSSSTTAIIPSTCARASIRPWKEYPGL